MPAAAGQLESFESELAGLARRAQPGWRKYTAPFDHWVAHDVYPKPAYEQLAAAFREVFARGLSEPSAPGKLSRRMAGYDAYSLMLTKIGNALEVFHTRWWHDHLAELTGVRATRDVSGAVHHHKIGSANGKVHNDLNPGWFTDDHKADGINVNDPKLCHYQFGDVYQPGRVARPNLRAVAMLYYLANPEWQEGDGGETSLYRGGRQPVEEPDAKVPPINNSMLVFECTPASYHSFLSNKRLVRNSVILWLHRPRADAVALGWEKAIVPWKR